MIPFRRLTVAIAAAVCLAASSPSYAARRRCVDAPAGSVAGHDRRRAARLQRHPLCAAAGGAAALEAAQPDAAMGRRQNRRRLRAGLLSSPRPRRTRASTAGDPPPMSEDCLTLNIWAPADAHNAPVFFWIYGGALWSGASREALYDGAKLAAHGIIVVTINYRLGVLGWLAHPELSAKSPLRHLRQLRPARSDRGAALGQAATSARSAAILERHHRGRIRRRPQRHVPDGVARRAGPVRQGDRGKRLHGLHASTERRAYTACHPPKTSGVKLAAALHAPNIAALRAMDRGNADRSSGRSALCTVRQRSTATSCRPACRHLRQGRAGACADPCRLQQRRNPLAEDSRAAAARERRRRTRSIIRARYGDLADEFLKLYPSTNMQESMLATTRDALYGWTAERLVRKQDGARPALLPLLLRSWLSGRGQCRPARASMPANCPMCSAPSTARRRSGRKFRKHRASMHSPTR